MTNVPGPSPLPETATQPAEVTSEIQPRRIAIIAAVIGVVFVAAVVGLMLFLGSRPALAATVRDLFIILMAFESLVIGLALIVLIVQLARLTNLLQHEIRPILESTNETVNTLRGTTAFLSENLVDPVVKLNGYLAAIMQVINVVKPGRSKR